MLLIRAWLEVRIDEPSESLMGIYRVMVPIGNIGHVTDR
jgi:hypothetical protein